MSVEIEALQRVGEGYCLRFRGDGFEGMRSQIKMLPYHERGWMPEAFNQRGGWWLSRAAFAEIGPAFRNYDEWRRTLKDEGPAGTTRPAPPPIPPQVEQAFAVLHLRPTAPYWLVARVRRFLADRVHPDKGGSLEEMQAINAAADIAEAWARRQHRAA